MLPFAWAWSWLLQPPTCWEGGGRRFYAEVSVQTHRRAQESLAEPQALPEPPERMGIPPGSAPPVRKFPAHPESSTGEAGAAVFQLLEQGTRPRRPGAGVWPETEPWLVCSPKHPGPRSQSSPESFWPISLFFSMQKKPQTPVTLQSVICWLLAGCSETVTEAPSRLVNAFQSPWQGTARDFLRDAASWEWQLFLSGLTGTSGLSPPAVAGTWGPFAAHDRRGGATLGTCIQG